MPVIRTFQILYFLVQLLPHVLKAIRAIEEFHTAKVNREKRRQIAESLKAAVEKAVTTKDTSELEAAMSEAMNPETKKPQGL